MPIIDDRTATRDFPLPNMANDLQDDVQRLREALEGIDIAFAEFIVAIAGKAAAAHGHALSDVAGLTSALAGKMPAGQTFALAGLTDVDLAESVAGQYIRKVGSRWVPATPAVGHITGLQDALDALAAGKADVDGSSLAIPSGSTLERPSSPAGPRFRYNATIPQFELWDGDDWSALAIGALLAPLNLSDLPSVVAARANIGVRASAVGEFIFGQFTSLPLLCLWPNGQNVLRSAFPALLAATTIAGTVAINATTSATLTLANAEAVAQVQVGMPIEASGIPAGATISSRGAATETTLAVTLSAAATATAAANAAAIFPNGNGNGTTTFGIVDVRGRAGIGRDNIGGTAASRVTTFNASRLGFGGGDQNPASQGVNSRTGVADNGGVTFLGSVPGHYTIGFGQFDASTTAGTGTAANMPPSFVQNVAIFAGA